MLKVIISFIFLISYNAYCELIPGYYEGRISQYKTVSLYLIDYPGRLGSYLSVIISEDNIAHIYLTDPRGFGKYSLTPLKALKNAVIGMNNTTPTLTLSTVIRNQSKYIKLSPNSSISGIRKNNYGFSKSMSFKLKTLNYKNNILNEYITGNYSVLKSKTHKTLLRKILNASISNSANNQGDLNFEGQLNDTYILRKVRPMLYLPLKLSMSDSSEYIAQTSNFIILFISQKQFLKKINLLIMIKNDESGRIITLKKDN